MKARKKERKEKQQWIIENEGKGEKGGKEINGEKAKGRKGRKGRMVLARGIKGREKGRNL